MLPKNSRFYGPSRISLEITMTKKIQRKELSHSTTHRSKAVINMGEPKRYPKTGDAIWGGGVTDSDSTEICCPLTRR